MGSWSESCALSGVEIPYGEPAYAMLVKPTDPWGEENYKFEHGWEWAVPPILGVYNDYGMMIAAEDNHLFGIVKDEEWDCHDDDRGEVIWISADIYNRLEGIPPEFTSTRDLSGKRIEISTLGERWAISEQQYMDTIIEGKKSGLWVSFHVMMKHEFRDITNLVSLSDADFYKHRELIVQMMSRMNRVMGAARETRRILFPGSRGPQHGGAEAVMYFADQMKEVAKRIHERFGDEED